MHEENNAEELTINRESVRKKTEPIAQKDVIQRTPMNTLHLPVTNETKGQQIVECSHKNMGETSDTKIQHKNGALFLYIFNINVFKNLPKMCSILCLVFKFQ